MTNGTPHRTLEPDHVVRGVDRVLQLWTAYGIPALCLIFTLWAFGMWDNHYPSQGGTPVPFRYLQDPTQQLQPAQALQQLPRQAQVNLLDTHLSEHPFWVLLPASTSQTTLEFPSRHAVELACWQAGNLQPLGRIDRQSPEVPGWRTSRAGFALTAPPASELLCRASFVGPARLSVLAWSPPDLHAQEHEFHRKSGLLDGGILVLALFTLMAGLINRNRLYLVFAAWLIVNLRMAALSAGWDFQWLGQSIPASLLDNMRAFTLGLYYVVTYTLFATLFQEELKDIGAPRLLAAAKWSCLPLLLLSVLLPYAQFLPIMWVCTGLGIVVLVALLAHILLKTRSRVAMWYAASITVALFASFYEVVAASLGLQGLIGTINSVTAALTSSLLASLAMAEQMRQAHQQRLAAQHELRHAYEVIPIGLFTLDLQGRWLSTNPALLEMLDTTELLPDQSSWQDVFSRQNWETLIGRLHEGGDVELDITNSPDGQASKRLWVKATLANDKIEGSLQNVTERVLATEHLQFLANHDTLTKALNRRGIEEQLNRGLMLRSSDHPLTVAYLDLDRFKLINDLYGHAAGDVVLQDVCARVQAPLGAGMHLGRVGGDEFLIVMCNTPLHRAEVVCRDIISRIASSPCQVGDRAFQVRGSIGLIEIGPGDLPRDVVSTADHACRQAKKTPPSGLVVYEQGSKVFSEHEAELHLIERLATHQQIEGLFLEMQPILSLRTPHKAHNFEVLLRMVDEHGQRVPTERLIHAGENAGRMGVIDRWVLHNTVEWLQRHHESLEHNQFVCLNLSGASLNDERFMEDVFALLDQQRHIAQRLCLEITESVALHDMGNTRRFIDKVRSFGAKVALDDFGAGYTSFSYLKDLPADLLKIDGSFIVNMNRHPANIAIVEAIVSLAQNLGMKTVAEWAEDFETVETLAEIGVDYVQGFVVARPQHPDRIRAARSGADFIRNEQLASYLSTLDGEDEFSNVDLVLGGTPPPLMPPA